MLMIALRKQNKNSHLYLSYRSRGIILSQDDYECAMTLYEGEEETHPYKILI